MNSEKKDAEEKENPVHDCRERERPVCQPRVDRETESTEHRSEHDDRQANMKAASGARGCEGCRGNEYPWNGQTGHGAPRPMSDIGHHVPDSTRNTMTDGSNRFPPRAPAATLTTEPVENLRAMADALARLGFDVTTVLARSG